MESRLRKRLAIIRITFLLSALAIAGIERILPPVARDDAHDH